MTRLPPSVVAPVLGLALLAACDSTTAPHSPLSPAEAEAVALALDDASNSAVDGSSSGASAALAPTGAPSLDVLTQTREFSVSVPCPLGGELALSGQRTVTVDTEARTLSVDASGSQVHTACAFRTQQGVQLTLTGTVSVTGEREVSQPEATATGSQRHQGSLDFTTDGGKSGTCEIDITTSFAAGGGVAVRTVSGNVCGRNIEESTRWTMTQG